MAVYIYEYVGQITTSWHDGGALVIVTDRNPNEAWRSYNETLAAGHPSNAVYLDESRIIQVLPEPDRVIQTADGEPERVYVFQDAGCC